MGKKDVTTHVPGESLLVNQGGRQSSDTIITLENLPVGISKLVQVVGSAQPAGAGTEDEDFQVVTSLYILKTGAVAPPDKMFFIRSHSEQMVSARNSQNESCSTVSVTIFTGRKRLIS
jgi:hypothetical protein